MKHEEKIEWMIIWAHENKVRLELEGECGFGRECVGIIIEGGYPDYEWYDNDYERIDNNGEIFIPKDAYHKHSCVAVLGRGSEAEEQLYDWLKWFDENNFIVEVGFNNKENFHEIQLFMGQHIYKRMVKK